MDLYYKVREVNESLFMMKSFNDVVRLINPALLEGAYERRPCRRRLRYIGYKNWPEPVRTEKMSEGHSFFIIG